MSIITGRVEILVNGDLLLNKAGAVASGLGISGEQSYEVSEVIGDTGFHGVTETPIMARCEVDTMLDTLAQIKGTGTIIFRGATGGKVYTMDGAYCTRNFSLTAGEGETTVAFIGPYWTESTQ
jgi:hypothetical protein